MARLLLAAVLLLGAAGVLVVALSERGAPPPPAAHAPAPAAPAEAAPARLPAEAPPAAAPAAAPPPGPAEAAPGPAPALPRDPEERRSALEPMRRQLLSGLDELRWRVERCELAGRSLVLTLETVPGGVRVVDVRVERPGQPGEPEPGPEGTLSGPDEVVAHCVRSGLAGNVVPASDAVQGRTWEMPWTPGELP